MVAVLLVLRGASGAADLLDRPALSGDWAGARPRLAAHGIEIQATYLGDTASVVSGGRQRTLYLDNLDVTLTAHLDEAAGIPGATVFLYGLSNHGGDPSAGIGALQLVDNVEAPDAIKLYEAWWQQNLLEDRASLLVGLYDLSSEFDVAHSAELLINSSFGVGAAFGTSGVNGPSIFPTTSPAVRLSVAPLHNVIVRAAVLDGVPGNPRDPHGTHVHIGDGDGALVATEAAFIWGEESAGEAQPVTSMVERRRRHIGRGWGQMPHALKLAVGTWLYTTELADVLQPSSGGPPQVRRGDPGAYLLADVDVFREEHLSPQGLSAFVQVGIADESVQAIGAYSGGGVSYVGLLPGRDADEAGFGIAAAYAGRPYRRVLQEQGIVAAGAEVTLEWTYRLVPLPWLALQPDVQWVIDPGAQRRAPDAVVLLLRTEITF